MIEAMSTNKKLRDTLSKIGITGFTLLVLFLFLMPMGWSSVTSVKTLNQMSRVGAPLLVPSIEGLFTYQGKEYELFYLEIDGHEKQMAMVKKGRQDSTFIDPENPEAGEIKWEGSWRTLQRVWDTAIQWNNFPDAWNKINFLLLLRNTLVYAILSTIGAVSSASFVAYGFARFNFPFKNVFFMIVMATIILPPAVTLIPQYAFFYRIGWVGTWLPLIVPAYFSNGYNIFLLRQFFLGIPREMDEAAAIDGAGPLRTFFFVILPQAIPAMVAITLFHFFYCWNDFFGPLVYLAGKSQKFPITLGLTAFNQVFTQQTNLIQAASLMAVAIPLVIFFFAQRFFMQGVVITGVEK